jgi:hypothetical protein
MSSYVAVDLRRRVRERGGGICEYCLIDEVNTFLSHEVEHVISEKHGGPTAEENLAWACRACNLAKGSDIASLERDTGLLVRFYHPRQDKWGDHFALIGIEIIPLTPIGAVTARILQFNNDLRLQEREALVAAGVYPSATAAKLMEG